MIKVYSKNGCGFCESAKNLLRMWEIDFTEIKIDTDEVSRNFLKTEGHRSVPQLYVGDDLLVEGGFDGLRSLDAQVVKERIKIYEKN